jgi:hypothetical protein
VVVKHSREDLCTGAKPDSREEKSNPKFAKREVCTAKTTIQLARYCLSYSTVFVAALTLHTDFVRSDRVIGTAACRSQFDG